MIEMDPFEQRLATRLQAYAATAARRPSQGAVARALEAAREVRSGSSPRPMAGRGSRLWLPAAAVLVLLLVAALATVLAAGGWLRFTTDVRPSPSDTGIFRAVGMLPSGTQPQAIVSQPDGGALVVARQGPLGSIFRFDPASGSFTQVGAMQTPRILPATVTLPGGRLLMVGGGHDIEQSLPAGGYRAEIFDPGGGESILTGSTVEPRAWGTATLLEDGRVLVAGGEAQGAAVATAELFDPRSGTFVATGSMSRPRSYHAAILLDDGRVLIVGGAGSDEPLSAELYDPETGTFGPAGPMAVPLATDFSATRLDDGRVLLVGGWDDHGSLLAAAQVYDPDTGRFTQTGSLPAPRMRHSAALLADGRVLIVGGWDGSDDATAQGDDAFIYDPATGTFAPTASLTVQRLAPFVVTLGDGRVLVVGSRCWDNGCYGLSDLPSAADREISAEVFK
jgi:hypothetical protein